MDSSRLCIGMTFDETWTYTSCAPHNIMQAGCLWSSGFYSSDSFLLIKGNSLWKHSNSDIVTLLIVKHIKIVILHWVYTTQLWQPYCHYCKVWVVRMNYFFVKNNFLGNLWTNWFFKFDFWINLQKDNLKNLIFFD